MGEVCLNDMGSNFYKLRDSQLKIKNYKKLECFWMNNCLKRNNRLLIRLSVLIFELTVKDYINRVYLKGKYEF